MIGRTVAVLALAASCVVTSVTPGAASSKFSFPGWYDTNASAAQSRANLIEHVLSPSAVTKVKYLRSVVAPVVSPTGHHCQFEEIDAPLPAGGYLYAATTGQISKYNPATGKLIWRDAPMVKSFGRPTDFCFTSLAISGNTLIAGGGYSNHHGNFPSAVAAYNATTGKQLWLNSAFGGMFRNSVAVAGSFAIAAGIDRGGAFVDALNLSTGKTVWTVGGCFPSGSIFPLVVGQLVISYGCDSQGNANVVASQLATGAPVWSLTPQWTLQSGDLSGATGKHLYATDPAGTVEGLNPQTGNVEYSLSQAVTVLAVDLLRVYATCGSQGLDLCAYNIGDGALEWQDNYSPALAAEADGVLYLDSGVALNAATGMVIKRVWSSHYAASAMAIGDGRIAVVTDPRVLDLYGLPGE